MVGPCALGAGVPQPQPIAQRPRTRTGAQKPAAATPPAQPKKAKGSVGVSHAEMAVGRLVLDAQFREAFCDCGGDVALLKALCEKHGLKLTKAELAEASKVTEKNLDEAIAALLGKGAPTGTV